MKNSYLHQKHSVLFIQELLAKQMKKDLLKGTTRYMVKLTIVIAIVGIVLSTPHP